VFQTRGPATENARSPTVERLTDGTIRRLVPPERNVRQPGRLATAANGPRYRGALPCKTLGHLNEYQLTAVPRLDALPAAQPTVSKH